jgi:hypothetical protein
MTARRDPFAVPALSLLALFNLAVAHPLYDVLGASPEFFVAHRAAAADLLLLLLLVSCLLPAGIVALVWIAGRLAQRAGALALALAGGSLMAALALQACRQLGLERTVPAFGVALVTGIAAVVLYQRVTLARTFAALLAPAIVLAPVLFVIQPAVRGILLPVSTVRAASARPETTPPIVLIVFDQLPLASLLDAAGGIDRRLYPAFAGVADDAIWFRNATAVSESTGWALPPIVTGLRPRPGTAPAASRHPDSLFTFLAGSYRMKVFEPITSLCPDALCPGARERLPTRLTAMVIDAVIVYLHLVAPGDLRPSLPPVTQHWRGFAAGRDWHGRWVRWRDADRREQPERFIEAIEATDRPTLYFLHALLPHEPYIYARSGQAVAPAGPLLPGLRPDGVWAQDDWIVSQSYQAHLLQLGYVDALLGRIIGRLKEAGLYDPALIVVTADHGASFRPGESFKALQENNALDILAVPLLVKAPGQRRGGTSDRNVETIDVAPTIAALLGTELPWPIDGSAALASRTPPRPEKVAFADRTTRIIRRPGAVFEDVRASVAWKLTLFQDGTPHAPRRAPHLQLVGREVAGLPIGDAWNQPVFLSRSFLFDAVDLESDFVPARLAGEARGERRPGERLAMAVAVNGRIRATTLAAEESPAWSASVPLDAFRTGRNHVQVFVVQERANGPVLHPAFETRRPADLNLVSGAAVHIWGVQQSGLYPREWTEDRPFHWTNGAARLVAPVDPQAPPRAIRLSVLMTGPREAALRVLVNGCEVFSGRVTGGWAETIALGRCALEGPQATVDLLTDTFSPGSGDVRMLGVAIESVTLLPAAGPAGRTAPGRVGRDDSR